MASSSPKTTRLATAGSSSMLALVLLSGCSSDDGGRVVGQTQSLDGPYALGQNLRIVSPHGDVAVRAGTSATEVTASFTPFVDEAPSTDEADQAMASGLTLDVDSSGNTIVVSVTIAAGALAGLGADVAVGLPLGFDGGFEIRQSDGVLDADLRAGTPAYTTVQSARGAVAVQGAAGQLDIGVGAGACTVAVQAWSTSDGSVEVSAGDLAFAVGAGLSGNISARAGDPATGQVLGPDPLPTGWTETAVATNEKSYAFGANADQMGSVALRTDAAVSTIAVIEQP